ncbi:hypothetical protein BASA83_009466 [Batrachochytrium salamandrivorans]|nr:hypothetical protein BASA83_009466 [Batrachochytrium salamandrivorans]
MSGAYHKTPMDNWSNPSPIAAVQSWQLQAQQQQQQQQQQLAPLGRTNNYTPIQHHHLLQIEHQLQLDSSFTAAATGNNTHYLQDSLQLAHFITSVVFILWRSRSLSESASAFVQFQNYVLKLLRSTSNNVTPPVILTSLKYIERLRSVTPCSPHLFFAFIPFLLPSHDDSVSGSGSPGTELRIWSLLFLSLTPL